MRPTLAVHQVRYHRNGVGGDGFYAVAFTYRRRPMLATVFDDHGTIAVVNPEDVNDRYRGDMFEDELRTIVNSWAADGRAFTD